ncbi:hypothetical protein F66182_4627 [Fusarium sp. NRRL 66182]|nr:hypothetical protein F66182_4627 [Fusarium sp. NRRL 66182]
MESGVSLVITELLRDLGEIVIEVLYEPDIPWFKIIAAVEHQSEISQWMHSRLERLLEAETGVLDSDLDEEVEEGLEESGVQPDIQVFSEHAHVISFPVFQSIFKDILDQYDDFRYPDHIKHFPYKTVWRSPAAPKDVTITKLLSKYEILWPSSLSEPSIEKLGELTNCQISHNLQGSLVYIGSGSGPQALHATIRKLDTLASFMTQNAPSSAASHLIFTERPDLIRLSYRWLTHTGLSRLTYVDPANSEGGQEYDRITGSVSLRAETIDSHGRATPDSTVYPVKAMPPIDPKAVFSPFADYVYGKKLTGTAAVSGKRPLQCFQLYFEQHPLQVADITTKPKNTVSSGLLLPKDDPSFLLESNRDLVTRWMSNLDSDSEDSTKRRLSEFTDFSPADCMSRPQTPSSGCQNLLDSDSPSIVRGLPDALDPFNTGIKQRRLSGSNLMDFDHGPIDVPALMDESQDGQSEVFFSKMHDEPKALYETMKQQAAPGPSWASIASGKKPKKEEKSPFGQNVRVSTVQGPSRTRSPEKRESIHINKPVAQGVASNDYALTERTLQSAQVYQKAYSRGKINNGTRTPRIVPGMELPGPVQVDCAEIIVQAERKLSELVEILQVTPGRVNIEAKFGRLCLKDKMPALVNIGQGPTWSINSMLKSLNSDDAHVGFYPILTTSGGEANLIPQFSSPKLAWVFDEKRVYYDFLCRANECNSPLVVRVDAETFRHECLSLEQDISQAFVHCTQHAWDIKFAITRTDLGAIPKDFEVFATSLVCSLSIETNEIGELVFDVDPDSSSGWHVQRISIHHQAKYRSSGKKASCLTIKMIRAVERIPSKLTAKYRGQSVPAAPPGHGQLGQWFEAGITSFQAEELLKENEELEFGEKSHWTPETMERKGVFKSICEPPLRMVSQMDQVGNSNDNGHGPRTNLQTYDAVEEAKERNKGFVFW